MAHAHRQLRLGSGLIGLLCLGSGLGGSLALLSGLSISGSLLGGALELARLRLGAARTDVLEHAEKRGDGGLVVVGALGAGRRALHDGAHGKSHGRDARKDANDQHHDAEGKGKEPHELQESAHGSNKGARVGHLGERGEVGRERRGAQGALARRVVVGNEHDGPAPLGDERPLGAMDGHDVLALRGGTKGEAHLAPKEAQHGEDSGNGSEKEPDEVHRERRDAREHKANEHEDREHGRREGGGDRRLEVLDRGLDVVLGHQVRDDLGGLELLLAVGGSDVDPLVEEVQIVVCHGHAQHPFYECRGPSHAPCIQSKEYTSCSRPSWKRRRRLKRWCERGLLASHQGRRAGEKESARSRSSS